MTLPKYLVTSSHFATNSSSSGFGKTSLQSVISCRRLPTSASPMLEEEEEGSSCKLHSVITP